MLETTSFVLLAICVNCILTEYTIHNYGWIPVPRDQVYNQIQRKWTQNVVSSLPTPKTEVINSIDMFKTHNVEDTMKIKENLDTVKQPYHHIATNSFINRMNNNTNPTESSRKAKKIADEFVQQKFDFINEINANKNELELGNDENEITAVVDRSKSYEVTEDNTQDTEQYDFEKDIGYDYALPTTKHQNISSLLINILSKYNIRADDKLQNYALSRKTKAHNPVIDFINEKPFRYNNPNHLPVDPLLAVFLSNYGVYLPGWYGIKSKYNNLYGYLASNNIHNNRPFGLYKIFSDTDSWK